MCGKVYCVLIILAVTVVVLCLHNQDKQHRYAKVKCHRDDTAKRWDQSNLCVGGACQEFNFKYQYFCEKSFQ